MLALALWLAGKVVAVASAAWQALDMLTRILAVAWLLKTGYRHSVEEEDDGTPEQPEVSGEGAATAEQRESPRTAPEDCRV